MDFSVIWSTKKSHLDAKNMIFWFSTSFHVDKHEHQTSWCFLKFRQVVARNLLYRGEFQTFSHMRIDFFCNLIHKGITLNCQKHDFRFQHMISRQYTMNPRDKKQETLARKPNSAIFFKYRQIVARNMPCRTFGALPMCGFAFSVIWSTKESDIHAKNMMFGFNRT